MVSSNKWLFQLNIFLYNPQSVIKMSKMVLKDEFNVAESCSMHYMNNYNCLDMLKVSHRMTLVSEIKDNFETRKKGEDISRFYTPKEIWELVLFPFFPLENISFSVFHF